MFVLVIVLVFGAGGRYLSLAVSYVESSQGLGTPAMEGGRTELEMADVDQDGNPDLVCIGDHGSPYVNTQEHGVMVWFGDGQGTWSVYQNGDFGYGGVAVGDVNNDGHLDVGYGMHHDYSPTDFGDQLLEVALGDGTGMNWQPWDDGLATNGETWGMFCTDFADVDGDGDLDIGSNSFGYGAGLHVYLNQGDGTWVQSWGFVGGNSGMDFVFGDFNGDGFADFAAAHQSGTVYAGDGAGGFTVADGNLPGTASSRTGPDLGDADGDGKDELSFCNSSGGVEVWKKGLPSTWVSLSGTLPSSGSFDLSQLRDMNGDGLADVLAFGSANVTVWLGDGAGGWTQAATFSTPSPGYSEAFRAGTDCDHNGYVDIVLVSEEGSWPNELNHLRFFREASVPGSLFVRPLAPGPGRVWRGGSVRVIEWTSGVPAVVPGLAKLELSTTGAAGPWMTIASSIPNNGSFQWIVPDGISSTRCWLRYTVMAAFNTASCMSFGAFTITPSPGCTDPQVEAALSGSELVLSWPAVPGVAGYNVFRGYEAFFSPDTVGFSNRVAELTALETTYADTAGVGNPALNAFYRVTSVGGTGAELGRSQPVGEFDTPTGTATARP